MQKTNLCVYLPARFLGLNKSAYRLTLYKKSVEVLLEIINSLGGMALWPVPWSYGGA